MKYVFTFKEINHGCIEIEADHKPNDGDVIEKILEGMADYNDTDFTDFRLVEIDGNPHLKSEEKTNFHNSFNVTITEKLQKVVAMKAASSDDAEQTVSDNWRSGNYILDAENFVGVEFEALPVAV